MRFRKMTVLLLVIASLLSLTACHGSRDMNTFEIPEAFDASRNYEITFWAKNDTNKVQTDIYEQAISDFEALYPNITVNLRLYTDYGKIYNDVITNIATQTTPNVCITYPDHIATYLTGDNTVISLDTMMEDPQYGLGGSELRFEGPTVEEMVPQFLQECEIGGSTYAVPYMRSTECCYVNKTLVEKLGYELPEVLTWDFVWEVSEKAMEQDANGVYKLNGQKVLIPFIYKSTDNMMIQMLRQKGAGYSNPSGEIEIFNDTTKQLLYTVAEHAETGAFSTFKISSYPANFLNAGQCLFAVDSTAGATWMGSYAPLSDISADKFVEFETEVRPVPQFDPEHPKMISQGPSICIFNKDDPQEVLASWLFTQYLLSNEVQIAYSQTEGYVPVTTKAQNDPDYQDYMARIGQDNELHYDVKLKAAKLLMDNTENTFVTPVFNGSASLRNAAGQLIENVTKSVRRHQRVDEIYMKSLKEDITSLYHLDQLSGQGSADSAPRELGPLPRTSVALLTGLAVTWVLIGLYLLYEKRQNKRK